MAGPVWADPLSVRLESGGLVDTVQEKRWVSALSDRWRLSTRFRIRDGGPSITLALRDPARPVWIWGDGGGGHWEVAARLDWILSRDRDSGATIPGGLRLEARGATPTDVERELERQVVTCVEGLLRRAFPVRGKVTGLDPDGAWQLGPARDGDWEPGMVLTIVGSTGLARLKVLSREMSGPEVDTRARAVAIARPEDWRVGLEIVESPEQAPASALWGTLSVAGEVGCEVAWGHALPGWAPVVALQGNEGVAIAFQGRHTNPFWGGWTGLDAGMVGRLDRGVTGARHAILGRLGLGWMHDLGSPTLWGRGRALVHLPLVTSEEVKSPALDLEVGLGIAF